MSGQASLDAQRVTTASIVLMLVVLAVAMIGAFLFSRAGVPSGCVDVTRRRRSC
ncbi:hypothetical protein [Burkholderia ubonensis]|uniref:hypothetical protein n=1 Tax=Burkholderia ubonensis TaxID=101571 RepID=UPI001E56D743|nr:hypothetical protein [Burkholderia ubonensis]